MSISVLDKTHASEIIPGRLWLGGYAAAMDEPWLARNNIQAVFNCTKDIPFANGPKSRYRVPIHDNLQDEEIENLRIWSPELVYKMLREYHNGNNILVHCAAGMQRSAAATLMFLMTLWRQPREPVFAYMREKRPIVFLPSMNFEAAVLWYEKWLRQQIFTNNTPPQ